MTAPIVDWGPLMDDWSTPGPAEPEVDSELSWIYSLRRIVRDRQQRMARARELMHRAYVAWVQARDEMVAAGDMLEEDARAYASKIGVSQ